MDVKRSNLAKWIGCGEKKVSVRDMYNLAYCGPENLKKLELNFTNLC